MKITSKQKWAALEGSIRKWRRVLLGTGSEKGGENCPLCQLFNNKTIPIRQHCGGCPVAAKVGMTGCKGTPYSEWIDAGNPTNTSNLTDAQVLAAKHEYEFLKSVRKT